MAEEYQETYDTPPEEAAPEQVSQEPMFEIDGAEVPFSKVSPEVARGWYEAHTNQAKWQASNTQKAQEIAAERKELEEWQKSRPDYESKASELERWEKYLDSNQSLREFNRLYAQQDPRALKILEQLELGHHDPRLSNVTKEIGELRSEMERRDEQARIDQEREGALAELRKLPGFDEPKFSKFFDEATQKGNDTNFLYRFAWDAYRGSQLEAVKEAAKAEYAQEKTQDAKAGVEKGSGTSAVTLPANVKVRTDGDYDEGLSDYFKTKGIEDYEEEWEK